MKKFMLLFSFILCVASCAENEEGIQKNENFSPDVSLSSDGITMTVDVLDIRGEYAIFTGKLSYLTDAFVTDLLMGIQYSTDKDMDDSVTDIHITEVDMDNMYVVETKRINFGEKYYYRPFIKINGITKYGKIDSFETMPFEPPTVTVKSSTSSSVTFVLKNLLPTKEDISNWTYNCLLLDLDDKLEITGDEHITGDNSFSGSRLNWVIYDLNNDETKSDNGYRVYYRYANSSVMEVTIDALVPGMKYYYRTAVYSSITGRIVYGDIQSVVVGDFTGVGDITDLSENGTANCYPVFKEGTYKFKATKGNSDYVIPDIDHVEVLWELNETSQVCYWSTSVGDVINVAAFKDGYVFFEPNYELNSGASKGGSAVIAAIDMSGNILWSWHIWVCNSTIKELSLGSVVVMDRNLGEVTSSGEPGGMLYQWGRKDPFPAPIYGTGKVEDIYHQASREWPESVQSIENGNLSYAIMHPMTIIEGTYTGDYDTNYDWIYSGTSESDGYRWQSSKTIYDPCPVGWKVPDFGTWRTMDFGKFYYENNGMVTGETAFPFFPNENYREYGYYWSSSVETSGYNAYASKFETNRIILDYPKAKSDLCYVRCVKDDGGSYADATTIDDVVKSGVDGKVYKVTGYITEIENWSYGNYYIKDHSGEIFIYGTLDSNGDSKKFNDMGIKEGDIVTVTGTYNDNYNELVDVIVNKHYHVSDLTIREFLNCSSSTDTYYRMTARVSDIINSSSGYLTLGDDTGSVFVSGLASGFGGLQIELDNLGVHEGSIVTLVGLRGEYNGQPALESAFCISVTKLVEEIRFEYSDDTDETQTLVFDYDNQCRINSITVYNNGKESYKDIYEYSESLITVITVGDDMTKVTKCIYELNEDKYPVLLHKYPYLEYGRVVRLTFSSDGKVNDMFEDSDEVIYSATWSKGNMTEVYSCSDIEEVFKFEYYDTNNNANIDFSAFGSCGSIFPTYGFDRNVFECFTNKSLLKKCSICDSEWFYEFDSDGYVTKFVEETEVDEGCIGYVKYHCCPEKFLP